MHGVWRIAGPAVVWLGLLGCGTSQPNLKPKYTEVLAVPPDEKRYSVPTKYPAIDRDRLSKPKDQGGGFGAGAGGPPGMNAPPPRRTN